VKGREATWWTTTLSSKVNLPHVIDIRAVYVVKLVTLPTGIEGGRNFRSRLCGRGGRLTERGNLIIDSDLNCGNTCASSRLSGVVDSFPLSRKAVKMRLMQGMLLSGSPARRGEFRQSPGESFVSQLPLKNCHLSKNSAKVA